MENKVIIGAALGNCVHVAGIIHFLNLAGKENYKVKFLGPAVPIETLFMNINLIKPEIIAISYRLTPANARTLLEEVSKRAKELNYKPIWVFGGTAPIAKIAAKFKMFSFISDGFDDINDSIYFLKNLISKKEKYKNTRNDDNVIERIKNSYPYPLLRHHFGLPSVDKTIKGVEKIAKSGVLDVISLGPDQNAQQFFFNPEKMKSEFDGAGGVPIRNIEDFIRLKEATKFCNYPLMRCYSGTADVFKYAIMLKETINNAWAAIPLCWYNELDGRGTRSLEVSIKEAQKLIKWHADNNIVVEINEPHHWGLRDSHDVIPVAMSYISAYNAKKLGVRYYIAQYMFNNPAGLSFSMDLARVLAMIELTETLESDNFKIYRQTRAGLPLFSADEEIAKGQLAASTFMQMIVKPHIIHVVGFCEANHAASAKNIIESCKIVKGVIKHTLNDEFSIDKDEKIIARKNELINEAKFLIDYIKNSYSKYDDPLTNAEVLADCVKRGILDAPHIQKNEKYIGNLNTRIIDGKCYAYDVEKNIILTEKERISRIESRH